MQPTDALDHEPLDPDATPEGRLIIARRVAGMTRATWAKLKPQVANVVRALRAAGHVADAGLSDEDLAAAMSLKATKNVEMLQAAFEAEPDNIPRVLGVMARFKAATETLGGAERAEGFEADAEGGVTPDPTRVAPLSLRQDWVPAVEQRGEGFFLGFDEAALRGLWQAPATKSSAVAAAATSLLAELLRHPKCPLALHIALLEAVGAACMLHLSVRG
jgi:hypothetical protein